MTSNKDKCHDTTSTLRKRKVESDHDSGSSLQTVDAELLSKKIKIGSESTTASTIPTQSFDVTSQSTSPKTQSIISSDSAKVLAPESSFMKQIRNPITPQTYNARDTDSDSDVSTVSKPIIKFDIEDKILSHVSRPHTVSVGSPSHVSMGYVSTDDKTNEYTDSDNGSVDNENTQHFLDEEKVVVGNVDNSTTAKVETVTIPGFPSVVRGLVVALFYAIAFTGIYMKLNPSVELQYLIDLGDIVFSYTSNVNVIEVSNYSTVIVSALVLLACIRRATMKKERSKYASTWYFNLFRIALVASFYVAVVAVIYDRINPSPVLPNSVYVAGGGFSGFWYTLGRLESLDGFKSKEVYCYSAGCLAAVSTIANLPMHKVLDSALDAQSRWYSGTLHRYDVVPAFIHDLLTCKQESTNGLVDCTEDDEGNLIHPLDDMEALNRLHVITTEADFSKDSVLPWITSVSRTVNSVDDLKHILQQSTWIPYVVGNGTSLDGHLDGAYTVFAHPKCEYNAGLTSDLDLLLNVVNINLGGAMAETLYQKGKNYNWAKN
jgi:hypothetical protein